jgi:hypothetical protein
MKKFKLITAISLILMISGIVVIHSCKKEKETTGNPNENSISTQDIKINKMIINFREKMNYYKQNPDFKSWERLSIDSAIWYIDATLNYYYAKANHPFGKLHIDTTFVVMTVLDSYEAMYANVFESYDASLNGFGEKYHAIEGENKQFIMAIVDDMGPLPNNKRKLSIITYTGTGSLQQSEDFGEDEAYHWHRDAQYDCNGELSPGAPKIFEAILNDHYNPNPGNDCRWYFYGTTTPIVYNYQNYPLNYPLLTNYLDYKIFAASEAVTSITEITECLEWNQNNSGIHEMQFYYDYLKELIDEWLSSSQNTNSLRFAPSIIESYDVILNSRRVIWHEPNINFRKRGMVCSDVETPPSLF